MTKRHEVQKPRGTCVDCSRQPQMAAGVQNGFQRWKLRCMKCHRARYNMPLSGGTDRSYRLRVGPCCERCGFIPEDAIQLDVDHKDGDHSNSAPNNLQTLCANCHRLKSKHNRDGIYGTHPR